MKKKELILCSIAHIPWCSFLGSELYLTWSFNPYPLTKIKTRKAAGEEEDNGMCTKVETNIVRAIGLEEEVDQVHVITNKVLVAI